MPKWWPASDLASSAPPRRSAARRTAFGQRLETFFKAPVWEASGPPGARIVKVHDLRFESTVMPRHPAFEYVFTATPDGRAEPRDARIW